jgi:hypothetical protein
MLFHTKIANIIGSGFKEKKVLPPSSAPDLQTALIRMGQYPIHPPKLTNMKHAKSRGAQTTAVTLPLGLNRGCRGVSRVRPWSPLKFTTITSQIALVYFPPVTSSTLYRLYDHYKCPGVSEGKFSYSLECGRSASLGKHLSVDPLSLGTTRLDWISNHDV